MNEYKTGKGLVKGSCGAATEIYISLASAQERFRGWSLYHHRWILELKDIYMPIVLQYKELLIPT